MPTAPHLASAAVILASLLMNPPAALASPLPMPKPLEGVTVERNIPVTMRDGVTLNMDVYWPEERNTGLPVILIRTPYNKDEYYQRSQLAAYFPGDATSELDGDITLGRAVLERLLAGDHLPDKTVRAYRWMRYLAAYLFASHGYTVAVQDTRGRYTSEGAWHVQGGDIPDGYDTIEWLSTRAWSNGKVGMFGCSYRGDTQIFAAKSRHPNLAAIIPQASGSTLGGAGNLYHYFGIWKHGVLELASAAEWMLRNGPSRLVPLPADTDYFDLLETLPVIDLLDRAGHPPTDWPDMVGRPLTDNWWRQFGYMTDHDRFDVPALFINSWWDFGAAETLHQFNQFRQNAVSETARDNQFMVMGPSGHCYSEMMAKDFAIGERSLDDPRLDYWQLYLDWFDYWLKGTRNGVTEHARLRYFLFGRNEWREAATWPVPGSATMPWYLDSNGRANSLSGDGQLTMAAPATNKADRFVYDPANPVRTEGGFQSGMDRRRLPAGPIDQTPVEQREDVLVYSSAPLEQGLDIVGPLAAVLYVSSSARDTDFTAKLVDVLPNGRALTIQEGIVRARYRQGYDTETPMREGEVYELRINLGATATHVPAGHSLRLEVSSSNFPRFARNLNTGGDNYRETSWIKAENTVHHGGPHPSRLILTVITAD